MDDSVITCDKIIDAKAKSYDEETKTIRTNFNENKATLEKTNLLYFTCVFVNYHCTIGSF